MKTLSKNVLKPLLWVAFIALLTACSSDDENAIPRKQENNPSSISTKYYILCEGIFQQNNSVLSLFDATKNILLSGDMYEQQNQKRLGDTANDMFFYDNAIYVVINGSQKVVKLNTNGQEEASFTAFKNLGSPRYGLGYDGNIYISCYGGYIAKLNAKTLAIEDSVKVGANPEELIVHKNMLYCVNSAFGSGNSLSAVNLLNFKNATFINAPYNPIGLKEANEHIYITSLNHNDDWTIIEPQVYVFNPTTAKCDKIADATRVLAYEDSLYMVNQENKDGKTLINSFAIYNAKTKSISKWNLTNAPEQFYKETVYMLERNSNNGDFFFGTTNYKTTGIIYQFNKNGHFIRTFSAGGINPNSMLFL